MNNIIKIFYDLETTGTDVKKHSIHQIAGIVEINDEIVEAFNLKTRPHPKAKIEPEALHIGKVTKEEILAYPSMEETYKKFISLLGKYLKRGDPKSKAYLAGFNNVSFDDPFLSAWFSQNDDTFFAAWFWPGSLDAMTLASQYLINRQVNMPSFKLKRVAKELGLVIDESRLHDRVYDAELARNIYRIVTGLDFEL